MRSYVFVSEAVVPLRAEPRESAEMVSQLLFGDFGEVIEEKNGWARVRRLTDGYLGWASSNMLLPLTEQQATLASTPRSYVQTRLFMVKEFGGGSLHIPQGASFPAGEEVLQIGEACWKLPKPLPEIHPENEIENCARLFLGTPYLWGGRSSFGIDCSGLTQTVYAMCGKAITRDSSTQAKEGNTVSWDNRKNGNLAFFSKPDKNTISHVGIIHEHDKVIHASGRVRIDIITEEGIMLPAGEMSHRLIQINHYF